MRPVVLRLTFVPGLVALAMWCGCARMPEPAATAGTEALKEVIARRGVFEGWEGSATVSVKHQSESFSIPVDVAVSRDLRLEVTGEISHFLLPFQGGFRLVNDEESTLLYTDAGVFDLGDMPGAGGAAMRGFLLSLAGGGDLLAWWVAERGCEVGSQTSCAGLKIELEPHAKLPSIETWVIEDKNEGRIFRAGVSEYDMGTLVPRTMKGTLYPEEITIFVEYSHISRPAGPSG
jgi:hypothetical protein